MILPKLTKVVGDIESLLGCFSSNTLWRWYSKLDFFLQDQVCEFRKWRSWLTEFKRFIDWYSWMERNRLWPTPAAWSSVKNCWLDKYRKCTRERTPAVRRVENILTEREISRTRRKRWWVDTSVMVLSQQRVTPGSTTFFFHQVPKWWWRLLPVFASCLSFDELLQIAAGQALEEWIRFSPWVRTSSFVLWAVRNLVEE